ncbi:MAG TPA: tripartite tricarboxylate transporter substrate binding protein [Microvirga sp.]|nr:tripartite tricarboxylate transporter substrate binding protein [Microvirga sp.]
MKATLLRLAALAAAACAALPAFAQSNWPNRPISLIVPFAAGGGTDAFARPLAQQLDNQLKMRVIIDNRAGAGGNTGAAAAAKAEPDGYTFFVGATHHVIAPAMYPNLTYSLENDFVPIGMVSQVPHVVVVHPTKVTAKTLSELIANAKANPGKMNYGSAGAGTAHHLAGELFKLQTGTNIVHVPYRGAGPAMQDLVAGQIDMAFDGLGSSAAQIQGGQIRALAVAAPKRVKAFPDLPTAAEAGAPGYEVSTFYALWAPKNTPPEIVERMKRELRTALEAPAIKEAWERQGSDIPTLMGAEFGGFVSAEIARWNKVVKEAGVKLEQ